MTDKPKNFDQELFDWLDERGFVALCSDLDEVTDIAVRRRRAIDAAMIPNIPDAATSMEITLQARPAEVNAQLAKIATSIRHARERGYENCFVEISFQETINFLRLRKYEVKMVPTSDGTQFGDILYQVSWWHAATEEE